MDPTHLPPDIDAHPLRFTGSGGEYFRVWIVNLLLSILTLGLYTPWARRRTARYFYDHTVIAGTPLEFTAPLRKMVFGFIVFATLYLAFNIASETGQDTTVALFLGAAALLAPYVWASAMRFRLASTRWRGLQLHFGASWKDIYLASWPVFAMAALWLGLYYLLDLLQDQADDDDFIFIPRKLAEALELPEFTPLMLGMIALTVFLSLLCLVRLEFNYKSLLVLRGGIGEQRGRWKPVYGDFVRIWVTTIGVFVLSAVLIVLAVAGMVAAARTVHGSLPSETAKWLVVIAIGVLTVVLALVVGTAPARAYREGSLFHLIWSNVGVSRIARFKSRLRPWAYVRLRMKNLLLTLLTLGFYRPFARVSEYRMKVDSVTLYVKGGLDQLVGQLERQQDGLGDALADAVGLDLVG